MLEPFVSRGYTVKYFGIDDNFNPDIKELESLLKFIKNTTRYYSCKIFIVKFYGHYRKIFIQIIKQPHIYLTTCCRFLVIKGIRKMIWNILLN